MDASSETREATGPVPWWPRSERLAPTGDADQDRLIEALYQLEVKRGEQYGWDQEPKLYLVYLTGRGYKDLRFERVAPRLWQSLTRENPADDLESLAKRSPTTQDMVTHAAARRRAVADSPAGFAAIAFLVEGWTVPPESTDLHQATRAATGQRTMHLSKDRVELRNVVAVDLNYTGYILMRPRGRDDVAMNLRPRPEVVKEGGVVMRALSVLAYDILHTGAGSWPRWPRS